MEMCCQGGKNTGRGAFPCKTCINLQASLETSGFACDLTDKMTQ